MALTQTIDNGYQLQNLFEEYGRGNSFSNMGFDALFNYLDELSEDIGEDIKIDVIGIDGDYSEYESYEKIYDEYGYSYNNEVGYDDGFIEWLNDSTTVLEIRNWNNDLEGVIIQVF